MVNNAADPPTSDQRNHIPVIGIVGGIGSGKSAVANWVAQHANVVVLNADKLGHEALFSPSVKEALCKRFGDSILGPDQEIQRSQLAQKVFGSGDDLANARHDLEAIVHPEIGRRINEQIQKAIAGQQEAVLVDAAVMLEAGWRQQCDLIVFIDCLDSVRLERVRKNRGWDEAELKRREQSQWSLTDKRRESDVVISNNNDLENAGAELLNALRERGIISTNNVT